MTFDFLVLIVLILIVFLTIVGIATHAGVWNLLTVPLLLYLIVRVLETEGSGLVVTTLAGFIAFQVYFALRGIIGGNEEDE
jgi:hypothetical protein